MKINIYPLYTDCVHNMHPCPLVGLCAHYVNGEANQAEPFTAVMCCSLMCLSYVVYSMLCWNKHVSVLCFEILWRKERKMWKIIEIEKNITRNEKKTPRLRQTYPLRYRRFRFGSLFSTLCKQVEWERLLVIFVSKSVVKGTSADSNFSLYICGYTYTYIYRT